MNVTLPAWTARDQARADAFEHEILNVAAQLRAGHPDVIVMAFVQTTRSLMRQRLEADPSRLSTYRRMLRMLKRHVNQAAFHEQRRRKHCH